MLTRPTYYGRPQLELLSLRPAPLQMTYMGHPGTSGAAYIQYVAVDPLVTPPASRATFLRSSSSCRSGT